MLVPLVIAALLICSSGSVWSQVSPETSRSDRQQAPGGGSPLEKGEGQVRPTEQHLAVLQIKGGDKETEFWPPLWGYRLKVTDTLLVAVTFLLFVATIALYRATRNLVIGAENTAKRQLRAYITTNVTRMEPPRPARPFILIELTVANTGQTPAYSMKHVSRTRIVDYPFAPEFDFFVPFPDDPGQGPLGPGEHLEEIMKEPPIAREQIEQLASDEPVQQMCTWGTVLYTDIFGAQQHTNYCVRHVFDLIGTEVRFSSHKSKEHNDAS
jgi:hypothetical protein